MVTGAQFAATALEARGARYRLGGEWTPNMAWPPKVLDCSELVEATSTRLGLRMVDGAANQYRWCMANGGVRVPASVAANRAGILAFRVNVTPVDHVAVTLGEDKTMEARSAHTTPQVGVFAAMSTRRWTAFVTIPGVAYSDRPTPSPTPEPQPKPDPQPQLDEEDDMFAVARPDGLVARMTGESWCWLTAEEWAADQASFAAAHHKPFPFTQVNDLTFTNLTSSRKALR